MLPDGHIPGFHLPGTLIPIAALEAEQRLRLLEQQRREEQDRKERLLLLLSGDDDSETLITHSSGKEETEEMFGILEFSRFKRYAGVLIALDIDGKEYRNLTTAEATALRTAALKASEDETARQRELVRRDREAWLRDNTEVFAGGVEQVRVTTYKSESQPYEEIVVEGRHQRVEVGQGSALLQKMVKEKFPYADPIRPRIEQSNSPIDELRSWAATWSTADSVTNLTTPDDLEWQTIPTRWVLTELDRLISEGWQLVQTSTDRGIYTHSDSLVKGGPVTLRYMFSRSST